jgi:hypothetical protein
MTKNIKLFLSCGAVAVLGALALQGCSSTGDDTSTPAGGSAGTGTGGSSTGGSSTGGKGGGSEAGATGEAGASAETQADLCTEFCAAEDVTCGTADLKQYPDTATCMTDCAGYALGTAGDTTGNTLECRIYHVGAAAGSAAGSATLHCPHTGPNPTAFCVDP